MADLSDRRATRDAARLPRGLRTAAVWLAPALLTLVVTGTGLTGAQLWRDELATWSAATRSVGDLFRLAGTIDAATGPYYLLMHGWVALAGDSVAALRLPSVLAMTGAAALTAVLGRRLVGARTGLLAGLLFALLPGTSRYAQEARPYALATLFAVLATLLLVEALRRPGWARWAGYAVALAALGLTHLVALTLLAAHAVAVLAGTGADPDGGPGRRRWWWLAAVAPALVLVAPLVLVARGQRGRQLEWVDLVRPVDLVTLPGGVAQSTAVGGLLVGLAALGAARLGRRALLPGCAVVLPVLLLFAAGLVVPLWVPRYLVFVVPFACLLAGAALAAVPLPGALAVLVLAGLLGLPDQSRAAAYARVAAQRADRLPGRGRRDRGGAAPGGRRRLLPGTAGSSSTSAWSTGCATGLRATRCWSRGRPAAATSGPPSATDPPSAWPACPGSGSSCPAGAAIRWRR